MQNPLPVPLTWLIPSLLSFLVFLLTLLVKPIRLRQLLWLFSPVFALLLILGALSLNTYPFSNLLVVGFGVLGGSLLGKSLARRENIFLGILLLAAAIDIASFLTGAQGSSPPTPTLTEPVALQYVNFTIQFNSNSHFRLGSLDILLLSASIMFFLLRGMNRVHTLLFTLLAMLSPYLYLLLFGASGGLPIIPFIAAATIILLLISRSLQARSTPSPRTSSAVTPRSG